MLSPAPFEKTCPNFRLPRTIGVESRRLFAAAASQDSHIVVAKPTRSSLIAADLVLSDFVRKPVLDGLSNANVPQIIEHCLQLFAIFWIEQTLRSVI